jgi:hypothetical protein
MENFICYYGFVQQKVTPQKKQWTNKEWNENAATFQDFCTLERENYKLDKDDVRNANETRIVFGKLILIVFISLGAIANLLLKNTTYNKFLSNFEEMKRND